jgi:glucokinase
MNESLFIGIDLGGTTTKIGAVSQHGNQLDEIIVPTRTDAPEITLDAIAATIDEIRAKYPTDNACAIGCGVPGILDDEKKTIIFAANLPGWSNLRLHDELARRVHLPVFIENDASVAALGEWWLGAGEKQSDFLMVTLGTGVGGGLIMQNKVHALNNVSCEFGHMIIDLSGTPCGCGRTGCLETFFSTRGLIRLFHQEIDNGTPSRIDIHSNQKLMPIDLAQAAEQNDPAARNAFQQAGNALGVALGNVVNLTGVQFFIIGGGVSNAWALFYEIMLASCRNIVFENSRVKIQIVRAQLGEKAGWIGAAALARWHK